MHVILGSGGSIGIELAKELAAKGEQLRLVSRNPKAVAGAVGELFSADISSFDQAVNALAGAEVAYLLVGLKYDTKVWRELWPRIMQNTIEACKRSATKLIFFDNLYMYGRVKGAMTEETPFRPISKKGEIRAEIATALLDEIKAGTITALIARCADFYGPRAPNGIPNVLVFDKLAKNQKPLWLVNDSVAHSFTFTPDAAKSLALLACKKDAWNQTWHLPTAANAPTGRQFIEMASAEFGAPAAYRVLGKPLVKLGGLFSGNVRELYEMLYQYEDEYIFDSSKFQKVFGMKPTPYSDGIRVTAASYKRG